MSKRIDLTGERYGRLTALNVAGVKFGNVLWLCRCKCGEKVVIRSNFLKDGATKSCGCLRRDTANRNRFFAYETKRLDRHKVGRPHRTDDKRYHSHRIKTLPDSYVKALILRGEDLTVTIEMIEAKREQVQLTRLIRKGKELINGITKERGRGIAANSC